MPAHAARGRSAAPAADPTAAIHDLVSYRLGVVSGLLSRSAALRYRRECDVSLWEWRAIALLGAAPAPLSLNELAKGAGLDKSQMSRVVSGLSARGLVLRGLDASDGRGVRLALSRSGQRTCARLLAAAAERDAVLRSSLAASDRARLDRMLDALHAAARALWDAERESSAGRGRARRAPGAAR